MRVISRLLRRAKAVLGEAASGLGETFHKRVGTVRKIAQQLHRLARRKGEQGRQRADSPTATRLAEWLGEVLPRLRTTRSRPARRCCRCSSRTPKVVPRFKAGKSVEFGRRIRLDEVEGGLITGYAILEQAGGRDQPYLADARANHKDRFGRAPDLLAADWGLASAANERLARETGVKQEALPHVGSFGLSG